MKVTGKKTETSSWLRMLERKTKARYEFIKDEKAVAPTKL